MNEGGNDMADSNSATSGLWVIVVETEQGVESVHGPYSIDKMAAAQAALRDELYAAHPETPIIVSTMPLTDARPEDSA